METFIINLDESFSPNSNFKEIEFEQFTFNGGEEHIKIKTQFNPYRVWENDIVITCRINDSSSLMRLLLAKNALTNIGFERFFLFMPYLPYARQDRICDNGESLSSKVFADIINSQKFKNVISLDAHSLVLPALINNYKEESNLFFIHGVVDSVFDKEGVNPVLIAPDAGSVKKAEKIARVRDFNGLIKCDKARDLSTGRITSFDVHTEDLSGEPCVIFDDICDGGGTFLGLADILKEKGAGNLYLAVTHGIFSRGLEPLTDVFEMVFSTDSINNIENSNNFKQINIEI